MELFVIATKKLFNYWPESLQAMRPMSLSFNGTMANQCKASMTIRVDKDTNKSWTFPCVA
jgi:hypothetical protein